MMPSIQKPIIIVGTGRCGSTLLHRLLALHRDVAWTSTFNEVFPTQTWLSVFSRLYRVKWLGHRIRHLPCFPKPFEAYRFWERFLPGFSRRDRPLTADDVPDDGIEQIRSVVAHLLRSPRRRFLAKVTGWSRIAYFHRIFPDARFVIIHREPRAVISSWIQAGWLDVTSALDSDSWQWGPVPAHYRQAWQDLGGGPILSAAVKIQLDRDDIRRNMRLFPDSCYKLDYDDLIANPIEQLRSLVQFCELPWLSRFEYSIRAVEFRDTRNKWRKHFTEEQGELILEFFRRIKAREPDAAMCAALMRGHTTVRQIMVPS
ncbi:MAG: sulfotransferase [Pirellulales bacterium]